VGFGGFSEKLEIDQKMVNKESLEVRGHWMEGDRGDRG
jgi:hypothetical protein